MATGWVSNIGEERIDLDSPLTLAPGLVAFVGAVLPYTLHPTPYTLHPTPYTLHPTPYTLHPTPYTLHPDPYTLHPTPYAAHPTLHTAHYTPYTLHELDAPLALAPGLVAFVGAVQPHTLLV